MNRESFLSLLKLNTETGCIEWKGGWVNDGYGRLRCEGETYLAHRLAWKLHHGVMPQGLMLHKCNNRLCCNVEHLYEGTHQDNANDAKRINAFTQPGCVTLLLS